MECIGLYSIHDLSFFELPLYNLQLLKAILNAKDASQTHIPPNNAQMQNENKLAIEMGVVSARMLIDLCGSHYKQMLD